jgi:hypothetical protein
MRWNWKINLLTMKVGAAAKSSAAEHGVMLFLLIFTVTIVALSVWLGAYLIGV